MIHPKGFEKLVQNYVLHPPPQKKPQPLKQSAHFRANETLRHRSLKALIVRLLQQSWQRLDHFPCLFTAGRAVSAMYDKHWFLFLPNTGYTL